MGDGKPATILAFLATIKIARAASSGIRLIVNWPTNG